MRARSIPAQVLATAAERPEASALVDDGVITTYGQLAGDIEAVGKAMLAAGVGHGDRISIWAPNSARWVIAVLGAQSVGAAMVPINTRYKAQEAIYPMVRTGVRLLVAAGGFMGIDARPVVAQVEAETGEAVRLVDLSAEPASEGSWAAFVGAGESVDAERWREALDAVGPEDLSDVMFTSGTTGRPKGVRHRHGPTIRQTFNSIEENGMSDRDRFLIVNPFFHVFGYTGGWVPGLFAGATVYPQAVFDVARVLEVIAAERITYFPGPPTIFHSILEHEGLGDFDISSLRASLTGSADVPVDLIQAMLDRLGFERVIQAYGMTECGTATNTIAADDATTVATTVGVASKDLEVRVVDQENRPVATGEPGEIVVRGYAVMDGYFDDEEATAATIDDQGWLHTGDRGQANADGYFQILGRIKDMYIVGGFNVYPAEVEDMLRDHPDVEDVAVIGVGDERLGEVGCAFVVARRPIEPAELIAWSRETMANFKVPRHVELVESFPLTASNKVSKVDLREMADRMGIGQPVT